MTYSEVVSKDSSFYSLLDRFVSMSLVNLRACLGMALQCLQESDPMDCCAGENGCDYCQPIQEDPG